MAAAPQAPSGSGTSAASAHDRSARYSPVLADFDQKLAARLLPPELVSRTRRSLKAHSINVCAQRFDPKDDLLLRSFFGAKEDAAAYMKAIKNLSAEVFRTLHNFLNDRSIKTDFNNIGLLAWLIDFQPRPYHPNLTGPVRPVEPPVKPPVKPGKGPTGPDDDDGPVPESKRKIIFYVLIFVMLVLTGYFIITHQTQRITGLEGCMIWTGDHYKQVSCGHGSENGAQAIGLDSTLFYNFKRITEDTLTAASLGKVWYIKIDGSAEFYTAPGLHPIHTDRRLLPVTISIMKKYKPHQ